jgi:hypothetical protein
MREMIEKTQARAYNEVISEKKELDRKLSKI